MASDPSRQNLRLEADTKTVEELVGLVRRGVMRIPSFQRGLKWDAEDVRSLFESIYKGYPIGALLLQKSAAPAARVEIGPLTIDGPETRDALWVVDGQQRLTALTVVLSRPRPIPTSPEDPWVVYFDAETLKFNVPEKTGDVPSSWVPVAEMLDASGLSEWVFHWKHGGDAALRTALFQAGARIRQYPIPVSIVETDDEALLRDIFYRVNKFGRRLKWGEVHDALFGHQGAHPSTLSELAGELKSLGMGRLDKEQLLSSVMAYKGLDVTRNLSEHHRRDSAVFNEAVRGALPALRGVLSFLRRHAEIPHLRLLPRSIPLVVLTRFFGLFPEPKARTLALLARWTWRTLLSTSFFDERTLLRHGVEVIWDDEEASAQRLLALVPHQRPYQNLPPLARLDARAADSRLALLGLSSLHPLDLDGAPVDVSALIETVNAAAFRRILPNAGQSGGSPANRIFLPGSGSARKELVAYVERAPMNHGPAVLESHALIPDAVQALLAQDTEGFMVFRSSTIENAVNRLSERLAAWSQTDRPSIPYLLQQAGTRD
jgi:hypothetical protein